MRDYVLFAFIILVLAVAIIALVVTGHYFWAAIMALILLGAELRVSDEEPQPEQEEQAQ